MSRYLDPHRLSDAATLACTLHQRAAHEHRRIAGVAHAFGVCALVVDHKGSTEQGVAALLLGARKLLRNGEEAIVADRFGTGVVGLLDAVREPERPANPGWTERRRAYLDRLEHAELDALVLVCADALFEARRIVADLWAEGQNALKRLEAGRAGTLWYFGALVDLLMQRLGNAMVRDLSTVVLEMHRLAGG